MTLRHAYRLLAGTIALGAAIAALPAQADPGDQTQNLPAVDVVPRPTPQPPTAPQAVAAGNPLWAIPLSQLSATRDRPIFSPSRRPPAPAVAAPIYVPPPAPRVATAEPERPPLTLVGTIMGERDAIAVFVLQGTGTTIRLRPNESHEGWVLRSVQGREARLEKGDKSNVLALAPPGSAPEPVTAQIAEPPRKSRR